MNSVPSVWPVLTYRDPRAALRFLVDALGLTERVVYSTGEAIAHAEVTWTGPDATVSGVMFGAADETTSPAPGAVHLVVAEPDALFARAVAAGATVVREPEDTDFGSRQFVVRDPEGHLWSAGTWYER